MDSPGFTMICQFLLIISLIQKYLSYHIAVSADSKKANPGCGPQGKIWMEIKSIIQEHVLTPIQYDMNQVYW